MSGLVLKLAPKERVLVNGAVIENGDRRSRLSIVTPDAHILRLRDAIHPEQANTPVRRVCYAAQLVLSGDVVATIISTSEPGMMPSIGEVAQCLGRAGVRLVKVLYKTAEPTHAPHRHPVRQLLKELVHVN